MKKLIFATNNAHKLEEVQQLLDPSFRLLTPRDYGIREDIPEEQDTLEGNARQKSTYIYEKTGIDCFADDTGLEVPALGGEPGVRSARYAGEGKNPEDNIDLLLNNLEGKADRSARFRTVISLVMEGEEKQFEGVVEGTIISERKGTDGFGYDPVFVPAGYNCTFAEMELSEKNKISHRARAVQQLAAYLNRL